MELKDTVIGIELGSTRIKGVLMSKEHEVLAAGSHSWENRLENGLWTYSREDMITGLQSCFKNLKQDAEKRLGLKLNTVGAIGISGMMHGYLPMDRKGNFLSPFRTWRNTNTERAAEELSRIFGINIPLRWSIAHLYQCILDGADYLDRLDYMTTLSGYIHFLLTGERVLGLNDASGMFPINSALADYEPEYLEKFSQLTEGRNYPWTLREVLPKPLAAGCPAGFLSPAGALLLDPEGDLQPGIPMVPPEGDAGTGMVATNSVRVGTGNVSAGTSVFAMLVLDRMPGTNRNIDVVVTPGGRPSAMVHCINCCPDIDAWAELFREFAALWGRNLDNGELYSLLFNQAMRGEADCGGLLSYNYIAGEHITETPEGRPMFLRSPGSSFNLANFMRCQLMSALATLKAGMDVLGSQEELHINRITAHGGFFKVPDVGQRLLSAALGVPVRVMDTAAEGGAYGMALLSAYMLWGEGQSLEDYLDTRVFSGCESPEYMAGGEEIQGFERFEKRYLEALPMQQTAWKYLRG